MKKIIKLIIYKTKYTIKSMNIKFCKKNIYLINTPEHGNLGDQIIAEASIHFLKKHFKENQIVEITHNQFKFSKKLLLKKIHQDSLIVITGGGYLGDLWEEEQEVFCDIVESFKNNKVIAFPQTMFFENDDKKTYYQKKFSEYKNIIFAAREENTYNFLLNNQFISKDNLILVPDIVLSYPQQTSDFSRKGILICGRSDKERIVSFEKMKEFLLQKNMIVENTDTVIKKKVYPNQRLKFINEKILEFSKYELVITDRLHGMIFLI